MASKNSLLLKGGVLLIHGANDHVKPFKSDMLIVGNRIDRIETDIKPSGNEQVVDCTNKLISPGFIDTHHHVWQTQLKGRHANEQLLEYMVTGNWQSSNFSPADFYWGQLGGCLEMLYNGTTTVVDHAHLTTSPEAPKAAISATVSSGIRSIFGYTPSLRLKQWNPVEVDWNFLAPWVMETFTELAKAAPFGDGRVQLGLAFDGYFLPKEVVIEIINNVKSLGVKTITSHAGVNPQWGKVHLPLLLESYGILDDSFLFSHLVGANKEEETAIAKVNAHVSCTPSTELQMGGGQPACFRDDLPELQKFSSLGIDCHTNNASSIVQEMRIGLQQARNAFNERFTDAGKIPRSLPENRSVEAAFNLGTIQGARAVRMEDKIGSIAVGKLADLVIFDMMTPGMLCAAEHDPVAAIVLHSSAADVSDVIVDGVFRKRDGKLLDVKVEKDAEEFTKKKTLTWEDISNELLESRKRLQKVIDGLDFKDAKEKLMDLFHVDRSLIMDKV